MSTSRGHVVQVPDVSTVLIDAGIRAIKRNPVPVGSYILGVVICIFFSGLALSTHQQEDFQHDIQKIDYEQLELTFIDMETSRRDYYNSKGWFFSCDDHCQLMKKQFELDELRYKTLKQSEEASLSNAKSKLGIFSEVGVKETRDMFWHRFSQGKGFATRQTKWDAAIFGFRAIARDENLMSYILSLVMSMLFNFTLGVIMTVLSFIWSLVGVIKTYQTSLISGLIFFLSLPRG